MIVGVVGGVAAGKSTVARLLTEEGGQVLGADAMAHQVLEDPEILGELVEWLGEEVLTPEGRVDRSAVAKKVFEDAADLHRLETMVHPEVVRRIGLAVGEHRRSAPTSDPLVLDVPLLASTPLVEDCDFLVFVDAPLEVRRERARRRGWQNGEVERRERHLPPLEDMRARADFTILAAGDLVRTRAQVRRFLAIMRQRAQEGESDRGP